MFSFTLARGNRTTDDQQYLTAEGAAELRRELNELLNIAPQPHPKKLSARATCRRMPTQRRQGTKLFRKGIRYLETLLHSAIIDDADTAWGPLSKCRSRTIEPEDEIPRLMHRGAAEAGPA
jgi:hypothetical protein